MLLDLWCYISSEPEKTQKKEAIGKDQKKKGGEGAITLKRTIP